MPMNLQILKKAIAVVGAFLLTQAGWAETYGNFTYSLNTTKKTATVTGVASSTLQEGQIPRTFTITQNGSNVTYTVTAIANSAFENNSKIQVIKFPSTLQTIGNRAFLGCKNLQMVYCWESHSTSTEVGYYELTSTTLTSIGDRAFQDCYCLQRVTVGTTSHSVSMGEDVFALNSKLWKATLYVNGSIPNSVFYGDSKLSSVVIENLASSLRVGEYAFCGCTSLKSFNYFKDVTYIDKYAFQNTGLTSVELTSKVTNVCDYAFEYCTSITSATIYGIVSNYAFDGCTSMTRATLGANVTAIGEHAFEDCTSLTALTIPEATTTIGDKAFNGSGIKTINIPKLCTSLGDNIFHSDAQLTSLTINSSSIMPNFAKRLGTRHVKNIVCGWEEAIGIPDYAFTGFELESVSLTVPTIGKEAFAGCSKLKQANLTCYSVGEKAFQLCTNLEELYLSNDLTALSYGAFMGCSGLKKTTLGHLPNAESYQPCFQGCTGTVTINSARNLTLSANNYFNGSLFTEAVIDKPYKLLFQGCRYLEKITLKSDYEYQITGSIFANCPNLSTINLKNDSKAKKDAQGYIYYTEGSGLNYIKDVPATVKYIHLDNTTSNFDQYSLTDFTGLLDARDVTQYVVRIDVNDDFQGTILVTDSQLSYYQKSSYWSSRLDHVITLSSLPGDINDDGDLTIEDLTKLIDKMKD